VGESMLPEEEPREWSIVIGLDGSEGSRRALDYAIRLAESLDAEVIAVTALDPTPYFQYPYPVDPPDADAVARVREELDRTGCAPLREASIRYRAAAYLGRPATVLDEVARRERADLVVVGRRGHGRVAEMLLGSVSHELSHRCERPVLIVSPSAEKEPERVAPPAAR
jgi:nucleotide-binding universal stress UspA family protein